MIVGGPGLVLEGFVSGRRSTTLVDTTERLVPEAQYDVALIIVRSDELVRVMPALQANRSIQTTFFMLNNPVGSSDLVRALGQDCSVFLARVGRWMDTLSVTR
jgi:hypothetical protein